YAACKRVVMAETSSSSRSARTWKASFILNAVRMVQDEGRSCAGGGAVWQGVRHIQYGNTPIGGPSFRELGKEGEIDPVVLRRILVDQDGDLPALKVARR